MRAQDVVKLAKIFDKFVELKNSLVLVEDCSVNIKAIRRAEKITVGGGPVPDKGIEIITPYGTFHDEIDFDVLKERVNDAIEVLKEKERITPRPQPKPVDQSMRRIEMIPIAPPAPTTDPNVPAPVKNIPMEQRTITLPISGSGYSGSLFEDPSLKIVQRDQIVIRNNAGIVVATGKLSGHVHGDTISGIIYENGKCRLAANKYDEASVVVEFYVQRRSEL